MTARIDTDKAQKQLQDQHQIILNELLKIEENKYCADCDSKGPRWASWNLGVFLCIRCAGIHRNVGVHISRVKSVNLDSWTPEQIASIRSIGNGRARAIYEAGIPDNFRRPQTDSALEALIRAKYEHKKFIDKNYVASLPRVQSLPGTFSSSSDSSSQKVGSRDTSTKRESKSSSKTKIKVISENSSPSTKSRSDKNGSSNNSVSAGQIVSVKDAANEKTNGHKAPEKIPSVSLLSLDDITDDSSISGVATIPPNNSVYSFSADLLSDPVSTHPSLGLPSHLSPPGSSSAPNLSSLDLLGAIDSTTASVGDVEQSRTSANSAILALYGPSNTNRLYGVPGGMYQSQQPMMVPPAASMGASYSVTNGQSSHPASAYVRPVFYPTNPVGLGGSLGGVNANTIRPSVYNSMYSSGPPAYSTQMTNGAMQFGPSSFTPQPVVPSMAATASVQAPPPVVGQTLSKSLWQ